MDRKQHWERVYAQKRPTEVSWYAAHLERSLSMIRAVADPSAEIIDVGGGASTLVDDLLALGYTRLSVLAVSEAALAVSKPRLGESASRVTWIAGDVTRVPLPRRTYAAWHDRAVFHFLTEAADRQAYVDCAAESLAVQGHLILATFSLDGPTRCSGLDVVRYDADSLSRELGPRFRLTQQSKEVHRTPSGADQRLIYCSFERIDGS